MTQSNTTTTVGTQPTSSTQRVAVDTTPNPHIPFVFAGALAASKSPTISVWDSFIVVDVSITFGTPPTGACEVHILKNGTSIIAVKVSAGQAFGYVLAPKGPDGKPVGFQGTTAIKSPSTATVQANDTFTTIAARYSLPQSPLSAADIQAANPSVQESQLRTGQVLSLPNGGITTGATQGDTYAISVVTPGGAADMGGLIGFTYTSSS